ncbi:MAG TPA: glycosyltransferase family 9 protein [Stellaceae bacterium]|jgi:ADP-heptose:LPS heptosyltransferase/GT2 family glycosyltransferase|nr:glycosyltransferase family 9 protein [Stellaceae bacterium]
MEALFSDYEDIRKSSLFDPDYYLATYPDVAERNVDPLVHYLEEGAGEGRNPHPDFDVAFYLGQCRARGEQPANPLLHYLRIGAARGFATKPGDGNEKTAADQRSRQSQGLAKAPILVAIEALAVAGGPNGTTRLTVAGWALAAAAVTEITVSLGGRAVASATYGLARPDIARLYPDRPGAGECGFMLAAEAPGLNSGPVDAVLNVTTADGDIGHHPLRVEIPPQDIGPETIDPLAPAGDGIRPRLPVIELSIDGAAVDPHGILRLSGWVVCRVQMETVEAFVDGVSIGQAELGRVRSDVETTRPSYPNSRFSGFALAAAVGALGRGNKTIVVRASARSGVSQEATIKTKVSAVADPAPRAGETVFHHHADEIRLAVTGRIWVKGWSVPPNPATAIAILLDGEEIGRADIGLPRPDVGNLFPALAHARRSGFSFRGRGAGTFSGEHQIVTRVHCIDGEIIDTPVSIVAGNEMGVLGGSAGGDGFHLHIDTPLLIDGTAEAPVRGNLEISGWALAATGVAEIEIAIDGDAVALADYGLRRLDLRSAFPDWDDALSSGYSALLPHRILPQGDHVVSVTLHDKGGHSATTDFRMVVEELSDTQGPWSLRRKMAQAEIDLGQRLIDQSGKRPRFVALLPLATDKKTLQRARTTLQSLGAQAYPHWRLLVAPRRGEARQSALRDALLADLAPLSAQVEIVKEMTPETLKNTLGAALDDTLVTVLTPGDELGCDALLEIAISTALYPQTDFFYSDERCRNPSSGDVEAFFKPQWSPDLLLATNYIGRLWCARGDLLTRAATPKKPLLEHGEYDLVMRCTEAADAIRHIPAVLCECAAADAADTKRATKVTQDALSRRGIAGEVGDGARPGAVRIKRRLVKPGLVSIIIPTCAADGMIEKCLTTLRRETAYDDYEIICIENIPATDREWRDWLRHNADLMISTEEPFNWARFNNIAAAQANGDYLLFLNDDIEIIEPAWLDTLLAEVQRPEIGAVGPRLLYPDRRVQHAGMFLAAMGQARHAFRHAREDDPGYFGLALTQREIIAVTGACLLTRRSTFEALGGFDETQTIVNNDLDYCLRTWRSGLRNLYTPHATLVHHEAVSRAGLEDIYDADVFDRKWRDLFLAGDPYFSPHLSKSHDSFVIDHEPTRLLVTGRPHLRLSDIRRILVVKLDHIGDCILAFPAVRRLKQHFPDAHVSVLTSRSSRPVWALEPSVDAIIEFDFFHARSGLGELKRTDDDYRKLARRLAPERFDLAIDLRKHLETRPVLQHSGARHVAGFDHRNQFPWLDIALEWSPDQMYARKRQHVADDLVNLVDAVAAAGESDRQVIVARPPAMPALPALQRLPVGTPLVCVHPTVGNNARQWPIEYFVAVINRLAKDDGAHIVLIGGPGDEAVAAEILESVDDPAAVTSLVATLPLSELPAVLAGMSLFLGNNSGPKHIAAGLGVPTVGVHSGTEDVLEWGPVGPNAIAVAREVVCAPCYLAEATDCRRGLACLRQLEPARVYEACKRLLSLSLKTAAMNERRPVMPTQARKPRAAPADQA